MASGFWLLGFMVGANSDHKVGSIPTPCHRALPVAVGARRNEVRFIVGATVANGDHVVDMIVVGV